MQTKNIKQTRESYQSRYSKEHILFQGTLEPKEQTEKFGNSTFYVPWYASEKPDLENEVLDIRVIDNNGAEYETDFTTLKFLEWVFEKNKKTGECANGTYFCMPGMVILEYLSQENIKKTIEELIDNYAFDHHFTKSEY